ncbi:MAG: SDR family oxidoreductase [Candidatus Magnetomorum sp.]|nr:SDR family oxidoreductase [Candidatus Magnetomorum sp.]
MLLSGKIAIVTGATRGIGFAIAKLFIEHGAQVFVNGRDEKHVLAAIDRLKGEHDQVQPIIFDISDDNAVKTAFQTFYKSSKKLDILVNNAGILDDALIGMVTRDQIEKTFATNTFSSLYMSQYAARLMARNKFGSIINMSSIIATTGNSGQAVYSGSKAALIGITKSLAKEVAHLNIRVNAIAPGFIDTDMAHSIPAKLFQERMDSIKMKRIGQPKEVAGTALFLASELSSYVTGQVIGVDGGMLI